MRHVIEGVGSWEYRIDTDELRRQLQSIEQ
jgi:hypothetical protein